MASDTQTANARPAGDPPEGSPQRGATRAPVERPVRLQFDDAIDVVEARCHDISIGGMFVHSAEGRPVGSLVRFELLLDDEASIRGLAEVVWMRSQDQGPKRAAGMGLKFRFLEQRDRQLIFKLVSQHIKERLAARHPGLGDGEEEEEDAGPPPIREPASTMERVSKPAAGLSASSPGGRPDQAREERLPPIGEGLGSAEEEGREEREPLAGEAAATVAGQPAAGEDEDAEAEAGEYEVAEDESAEDESAEDESGQRRLFDAGGQTAASAESSGGWLQEGLRGDGFADRAGFAGGEDEDPGEVERESGEVGYESELYEDEGHFEHRPGPRRDVPVLVIAAVLVAALAVAAYLWGDRLFDDSTGEEGDVVSAPLAEGMAGADGSEGDLDGAGEESEAAGERPAAEEPTAGEEPTSPEPATAEPPPAQTQRPGEPVAAGGDPFRRVLDISARAAGPAVEIVITTDGRVDSARFSHARIAGGAPRELIRLRGLTERFRQEVVPVGIGAVRQVRTGWHQKRSGNELHVVIDLSRASAEVASVRVEGRRIIATIEG